MFQVRAAAGSKGWERRVLESGIGLLIVIKPKYAKVYSSNCSRQAVDEQ